MDVYQGTAFDSFESRGKLQESTNDLSECLRATADVFFDALVKVDVKSTIEVVNYMADKISRFIIHHHTTNTSGSLGASRVPSSSPPSCTVHWTNLLQGFTSSILPTKLSVPTLHLLTFVDILENIKRCKEGLHDTKTFYDLYQLLSCVSWFSELKKATYYQEIIHELQEETRNQELICHYVITKSIGKPEVKTFCDDHSLSQFCKKTIEFVSSVIQEKFNEPGVKVHDGDQSNIVKPPEQDTRVNDSFETDKHSWIEIASSSSLQSTLDSVSVSSDSEQETISADEEQFPIVSADQVNNARSQTCSSDSGVAAASQPKLKRVRWTSEEIVYLTKGVKKYGPGGWATILKMYPFQERTVKALSDKWQVIQHSKRTDKQQVNSSKKTAHHKKIQLPKVKAVKPPTKKWTTEEIELLKKGVETLGAGNWKLIKESYAFNGRSNIALFRKWSKMQEKH